MFRILITGSRKWRDREVIAWALQSWKDRILDDEIVLISGAADRGADLICEQEAAKLGFAVKRVPADWYGPCTEYCRHKPRPEGGYCPVKGVIRNSEMVAMEPDVCLGFPLPGGTGTQDCMKKAAKAGIPTFEVHGVGQVTRRDVPA